MKVRLTQNSALKQKQLMRRRLILVAAATSITGLIVALVFLFNIGNVRSAFAATTTYYSRTDGTFHAASTWSTTGYGGAAAASFPGPGDIVYIKHAIKLNQDLTIGNKSTGNLTIEAGGSLIENGSRTITIETNGSHTLTNNGTLEINKINMWAGTNAGKIVNNGTATIKTAFVPQSNTMITNSGKFNFLSTVELQGASFLNKASSTLTLNGTFWAKASPASKVENYGTIISTSTDDKALYLESAEFYNYATGIIDISNGGFFNNGNNTAVNNNLMKIKNFFSYNTGSFLNTDSLIVSGNLTNELKLTNQAGGYIKVGGNFKQNTANYTDNSGFMEILGNFDNYGSIKGAGGGISITGVSTNWWNGTISGNIDICDKTKTNANYFVDINNNTSTTAIAGTVTKCSYQTTTNTALPVSLISWDAKVITDYVQLSWATASEINNDYFTIERSEDGKEFEKIATVKGAGNSQQQLKYGFKDEEPLAGISYYRLKQTDFNGQFEYFPIKSVKIAVAQIDNVGPNPFSSTITVGYNMLKDAPVTIQLLNMNGAVVYESVEHASQGNNSFIISNQQNLPKGTYILRLVAEGQPVSYKLIKS